MKNPNVLYSFARHALSGLSGFLFGIGKWLGSVEVSVLAIFLLVVSCLWSGEVHPSRSGKLEGVIRQLFSGISVYIAFITPDPEIRVFFIFLWVVNVSQGIADKMKQTNN